MQQAQPLRSYRARLTVDEYAELRTRASRRGFARFLTETLYADMRTFPKLMADWVGKRSVREACLTLGVSPNTLGNWLKGSHLPPLTRRDLLATQLRMKPEQLREALRATTDKVLKRYSNAAARSARDERERRKRVKKEKEERRNARAKRASEKPTSGARA